MVVDGLMRTLELSQVALARFDDDGISKTGETDRQTDTRPLLYTVAAGGLVRTLELRQVALARLDDGRCRDLARRVHPVDAGDVDVVESVELLGRRADVRLALVELVQVRHQRPVESVDPTYAVLQHRRVADHRPSQLHRYKQEAQLSPRDRAMRRVNRNLANCHATVQKLLIRQVLTKSMV